jgi:hypothetical protein
MSAPILSSSPLAGARIGARQSKDLQISTFEKGLENRRKAQR